MKEEFKVPPPRRLEPKPVTVKVFRTPEYVYFFCSLASLCVGIIIPIQSNDYPKACYFLLFCIIDFYVYKALKKDNDKKENQLLMSMQIKPGLQFRSTQFKGLVTVIACSEVTNLLHVKIDPQEEGRSAWEEDGWNLEHTKHGFERGDYFINQTEQH